MDEVEAVWAEHHQRAMDVAYRLLGRLPDAEDAVQEAYARLLATDLDEVGDPRGWLTTVTARICLDHLRRHEQSRRAYVGPWLPDPLVRALESAPGIELPPEDRGGRAGR